jgi:hypothetical protein
MDADDDLPASAADLDKHGVPIRPPPAQPICQFLLAAFCLGCASVPVVMLFGPFGNHAHLRLELRLEAMAGGLVIIVPWFLLRRFTLRRLKEDLHGPWLLIAVIIGLCTVAAIILFFSGLTGSICQHNCGSY